MFDAVRRFIGRARQRMQRRQSIERAANYQHVKLEQAIAANDRACDENARVREMLENLLRHARAGVTQ